MIAAFWIVSMVMPLITMFSTMTQVNVLSVITSGNFLNALKNSLYVGTVATLISVALAWLLAWCTMRTRIFGSGVLKALITLPMLIPSISHGMGLVILFGSNGILRNLLNISGTIYGFWGIVIGSVMYSFPVAYLMLSDILSYEDSTPYEAADVLGLSKWNRFTAITLPYMRKPLISVVFATFSLIVTDYGVPLMIGGKFSTLPVVMYQDVIGLLDFGKGSVIGIVLLIPTLIDCIIDMTSRDKGKSSYVTKPFTVKRNRARDIFSNTFCIIVCVCVLLPIVTFACISFIKKYPIDTSLSIDNVLRALQMGAGKYIINSIVIALAVTVIGVSIAILTSYITARLDTKLSGALHLMSISSLAIPGIVLGLSYVLFFKGSFIYGTFAILILVNMMHFFSSPYLMMYNTFGKLNNNLEAVGATLGIGRFHIIKDVLLPQSKSTIIEMASYFFVNCMMTISAVSFLSTVATKPVALMITQFEGQMQIECAAFVSLIILLVNILIKAGLTFIKRTDRISAK